jgi:hypothetical protein
VRPLRQDPRCPDLGSPAPSPASLCTAVPDSLTRSYLNKKDQRSIPRIATSCALPSKR